MARTNAEFELVDLRDYPLPHLDAPQPPAMGRYPGEHTKKWAEKIASFDGFVLSYGGVGGARPVEHLRLVGGELRMANVRQPVALSRMTEFENFSVLKPGHYNVAALGTLLDQVVAWSRALPPLRTATVTA
ncbi:NADPH-dependent FMN reductase [Streptomyces sp. NPDC002643]